MTIGTGDVSFALQFEDATIGSARISNLIITPGSANYSTDVHYQPQGSAVSIGETLLENSLQGIDSDTTILGSTDTTPIDSLKPALAEIQLSPVVIPALHQNIVTGASLVFPTDIAQTGLAQAAFTLSNPFTAGISLPDVNAMTAFNSNNVGFFGPSTCGWTHKCDIPGAAVQVRSRPSDDYRAAIDSGAAVRH